MDGSNPIHDLIGTRADLSVLLVQGMLGVDEDCCLSSLLGLGDRVEGQGRLPATLGTKDLHNDSGRYAAPEGFSYMTGIAMIQLGCLARHVFWHSLQQPSRPGTRRSTQRPRGGNPRGSSCQECMGQGEPRNDDTRFTCGVCYSCQESLKL